MGRPYNANHQRKLQRKHNDKQKDKADLVFIFLGEHYE